MVAIPGLPDPSSTHLSTTTIEVDGQALPGTFRVVGVDVHHEVNRVPRARVVFQDGDAARQTFELSSDGTLVPGAEIEIKVGYAREESSLFKGVITRQRIEAPVHGDSLLHVEARDAVFRMTLARKSRVFADSTDSDAMEALCAGHQGVSARVTPTTAQHTQIVQHQVSDWDFLVQRAEQLGMLVLADAGTLAVAEPDIATPAVATLTYGQGMREVELELDAATQYATVETGAWDAANQELATADTEDARAPAHGNLTGSDLADVGAAEPGLRHSGALDAAALDAWAGAAMLRSRFAAIRGTVTVQGSADLVAGGTVELAGLGDRFNGTAYISGVRHQLAHGDWLTTVQLGLDPRFHAERFPVAGPAASGRIAPVAGMHIGVVEALEGDPAGEERIQVRLVTVTETEGLVWARLALADAGGDRGAVFRPEIGDEVVLGFLNDDPRHPVVLGALHSSAAAAPLAAADDNHEKGWVTRSGMRVVFDDDKVALTIETPNGNKAVLSDDDGGITFEDENGNKVVLDSNGIEICSASDLKLKATADLSVEGVNVAVAADAEAKVEGGASAGFTSGGQTEVSGSLVKIN